MTRIPTAFTVLLASALLYGEPVPLFDGRTFNGWEGDTTNVWRIERDEIVAGKLDEKQRKNDFLCTTRDYGDFDLRLQYKRGTNNGGIQFRSERVPNHHEVKGYQADFAPGIDGFLYDESRRRRFLAAFDPVAGLINLPPDGAAEAMKRFRQSLPAATAAKLGLGEWNRYRIRAEGPRIRLWINDVLTVDYTEADPDIPRSGKIALQIHSGATEIRYKDIIIEEIAANAPKVTRAFTLRPSDTIALLGGSNIERTRFHGFLQSHLIGSSPEARIRVRNFGWEGGTVFEQWRDDGNVRKLGEDDGVRF